MDIRGKRILVLGGFGLVGQAVIRRLMLEKPAHIILTSIRQNEAEEATQEFRSHFALAETTFEAAWGNIFVRQTWKDMPREAILTNAEQRSQLIDDTIGELSDDILHASALYQLLKDTHPDAIVDCINTSTAIAYQDLFTLSQKVRTASKNNASDTVEQVERLLASLYIPQLIRHVQILHHSLIEFKINAYLKVGTSGTGGMGLNIPFTHSEERPSRVLLSKSSVAGAHTLLLFLMARTPNAATIVKEIKPTATIGWKEVAYGPIRKGGKAIELSDVAYDDAETLGATLSLRRKIAKPTGEVLESVYIDTGENGIFSKGEFEAISALGLMEIVTPEEIAENVARELLGASTGKDVIAALDASSMGPSYRAGYLRETALRLMTKLEEEHSVESTAFEMLGPPRLAKLLFEGHLLKRIAGNFDAALEANSTKLAHEAEEIIRTDKKLRSHMLSIGIPVLLPDGKKLLRGDMIKIPPANVEAEVAITESKINEYAREGWVDLRAANWDTWKQRLTAIRTEAELGHGATGSEFDRSPESWDNFSTIDAGRIAAWVFLIEEGGQRIKR